MSVSALVNAPPPPHPPLDINRETVVQLYFQSSLSRELRFCDDQLVKLLRLPFPTLYIYIKRREEGGFSFGPLSFHPPFGIFQNGHEARVGGKGRRPREGEKRRKREKERGREREREKKLAEHRMEYRHSLNYFLVVRRSGA